MRNRMGIAVIVLAALALVVSPGCVSKKDWRASVEGTDTRMNSVENAVEANEKRIKDLNSETDDALAALGASAAERAYDRRTAGARLQGGPTMRGPHGAGRPHCPPEALCAWAERVPTGRGVH